LSTEENSPGGADSWPQSETVYASPYAEVNLLANLLPYGVAPDDYVKSSISWSQSGWFSGSITYDAGNPLSAIFKSGSTGDYIVTVSCGSSKRVILVRRGDSNDFLCNLQRQYHYNER